MSSDRPTSFLRLAFGKTHDNSLARQAQGIDRLVEPALVLSLVLLIFGLIVPVLRVDKLLIFTDQISILSGIYELMTDGEWFLAIVIGAFSVLAPVYKLDLAFRAWRTHEIGGNRMRRAVRTLDLIGKWAMLDVFVVALVIFTVKNTGLANAVVEPGLYLFVSSILLSMTAIYRVRQNAVTMGTASPETPPNGSD